MQLAPMRYTRIDGTAVAVSVKSAIEAKAAVKELRHKKRELKFLRAALVRQQRALRPKQPGRRRGAERSPSLSRTMIDGLGGLIGGLFDHATTAARDGGRRSLADIEREIRQLDETLHNIEGCILQLQGKLLTRGEWLWARPAASLAPATRTLCPSARHDQRTRCSLRDE